MPIYKATFDTFEGVCERVIFNLHSFDAKNNRQHLLTVIIMSYLLKLWVSFNSNF